MQCETILFTSTSLLTVLLGASCLAQSVFLYQNKLQEVLKKSFKYKRLFKWASVAFALAAIIWGTERLAFSTRYADPTLLDYFVLLLVGILGLVALSLQDRLAKRAIKRNEVVGGNPQAESAPP